MLRWKKRRLQPPLTTKSFLSTRRLSWARNRRWNCSTNRMGLAASMLIPQVVIPIMNTYVNYRYCYVPWERLHIGALIERHTSRGRLVEGLDDSFLRFEDC